MGKLFDVVSWVWSKIGKQIEVFLSHYGVVVAAISLAGALVCVYFWAAQVEKILSFSAQMLKQEREPVAQRFSALESLVLSGLDKPAEGAAYARSHANDAFVAIDRKLERLTPLPSSELAPKLRFDSPEENPRLLRTQYVSLADAPDNGAAPRGGHGAVSLFVPGILLPVDPVNAEDGSGKLAAADLGRILDRDPQLRTDLSAALEIFPDLQKLATTDFEAWKSPIQAYFITRAGVFAGVVDTAHTTQRSPTRVYFAERPYFWKTIALQHGEFYLTYPYIDLLGKGIVFTACRAVAPSQVSDAIVCLDFQMPDAMQGLRERLRPFQIAEPLSLSCTVVASGDVVNCTHSRGEDYSQLVDLVDRNLQTLSTHGNLDQITGGVFQLEGKARYKAPLWKQGLTYLFGSVGLISPDAANGMMYFTVPEGKGPETQSFLVYAIDVNTPQWSLLGYGLGFAFCLALLALSLYYTHQARALALKFVDDLEKVMDISPVAFIHLNEDTHIIGSNEAFRALTGYTEEQLKEHTLASILSKRSALRYRKVAELRQQYLMANPYEVELVCANGLRQRMVVQGAPLHMPPGRLRSLVTTRKDKGGYALPHTFGILVPPAQTVGRFIDLTIGDDLFAAALQVDLHELSEDEEKEISRS